MELTNFDENGVPFLNKRAFDRIAIKELKKFSIDLNNCIDIESLIEFSYKLNLEFMKITMDCSIHGMISFEQNKISGYDETKIVKPGTIIIEEELVNNPIYIRRLRFTLAHELAHWILHKNVKNKPTTNSFECLKGKIEVFKRSANKNSLDFIEYQADSLASSFLMPLPIVKEIILKEKEKAIEIISEKYNVSKKAAEVRVKKVRELYF